jgi:hypothetical protein
MARTRTTGAIVLHPTGNAQGRYYFFSKDEVEVNTNNYDDDDDDECEANNADDNLGGDAAPEQHTVLNQEMDDKYGKRTGSYNLRSR